MSYDLDGFPLPPGRTAQEFIESGDREALADDDSNPTPEQRAAMERTAAALMEIDPSVERFEDDEAIELTGEAIQVSLFAREAGITIPYWFEGDEADAVLARAHAYARVIADTLGYTIFDPQTGEVVDTAAPDSTAARAAYGDGVAMTQEIARDTQRPWWKIWG
jgi:hypothetical protein